MWTFRACTFAMTTALALAASACGQAATGPSLTAPAAPTTNDPAFAISELRSWYLIGNAATPGQDTLTVRVAAPEGVETVDWWLDDQPGRRMIIQDGAFIDQIDIGALAAGPHRIVVAEGGAETGFAALTFTRSHPYYVVMSTDWDVADPGAFALDRHDQLHRQHPDLKITHFIGPYTFTDPEVLEPRRQELAAWARGMRDDHGDELALHIHPYCNFVETAGLTCITDQSVVYAAGDATGYSIKLAAYDQAQTAAMLTRADELFTAYGLGQPRTFRAGGWTAGPANLRALAAHGYVADTSALNWARLEEWEGYGNGELYNWNMTHWTPIGDTSQPYYPNQDDPLSSAAPTLPMLQVPDNGIMVDYVSVAEMVDIFNANWDGTALAAPRTLMLGFHPSPNFSASEFERVDGILTHADQHLAATGTGPVVYTTLRDLTAAYPR